MGVGRGFSPYKNRRTSVIEHILFRYKVDLSERDTGEPVLSTLISSPFLPSVSFAQTVTFKARPEQQFWAQKVSMYFILGNHVGLWNSTEILVGKESHIWQSYDVRKAWRGMWWSNFSKKQTNVKKTTNCCLFSVRNCLITNSIH